MERATAIHELTDWFICVDNMLGQAKRHPSDTPKGVR